MIDSYCNPFIFNVTHYEEWCNQNCVSKTNVNIKIVAIPANGYLSFRILGDLNLNLDCSFGINMQFVKKCDGYIQYGEYPSNMLTKKADIPLICVLFDNLKCIRFKLLCPSRLIDFYGSYQENAEICSVERGANRLVWLYKKRQNLEDEGFCWLHSINKNPIELMKVHNPQVLLHGVLSILSSNVIKDLDLLELIGNIGYWGISRAIELEPNNIYLYCDRLMFMVNAMEAVKWAAMKALNLLSSPFSRIGNYTMAELWARDAVYKMIITDMYQQPETYLKNDCILNYKINMDRKIKSGFFSPEKSIEQIIETGNLLHGKMFDDLYRRIRENDFDI